MLLSVHVLNRIAVRVCFASLTVFNQRLILVSQIFKQTQLSLFRVKN